MVRSAWILAVLPLAVVVLVVLTVAGASSIPTGVGISELLIGLVLLLIVHLIVRFTGST